MAQPHIEPADLIRAATCRYYACVDQLIGSHDRFARAVNEDAPSTELIRQQLLSREQAAMRVGAVLAGFLDASTPDSVWHDNLAGFDGGTFAIWARSSDQLIVPVRASLPHDRRAGPVAVENRPDPLEVLTEAGWLNLPDQAQLLVGRARQAGVPVDHLRAVTSQAIRDVTGTRTPGPRSRYDDGAPPMSR